MAAIVYIATSLDGYIADRNGQLDWLDSVADSDAVSQGWAQFLARIDAIVMGRTTFETVCGFAGDWPYPRPVFVLSETLTSIPDAYREHAQRVSGPLPELVSNLQARGLNELYIDGGRVIQSFLQQDLIDELIITRLPILLGGGTPLFGSLPQHLTFTHVETRVLMDTLVQSRYLRQR